MATEAEKALKDLEKAVADAEEYPLTPDKDRRYCDAKARVDELDQAHERGYREPVALGYVGIQDDEIDDLLQRDLGRGD